MKIEILKDLTVKDILTDIVTLPFSFLVNGYYI